MKYRLFVVTKDGHKTRTKHCLEEDKAKKKQNQLNAFFAKFLGDGMKRIVLVPETNYNSYDKTGRWMGTTNTIDADNDTTYTEKA